MQVYYISQYTISIAYFCINIADECVNLERNFIYNDTIDKYHNIREFINQIGNLIRLNRYANESDAGILLYLSYYFKLYTINIILRFSHAYINRNTK